MIVDRPFVISLQGSIGENPDKSVIDGILESIKNQVPSFQASRAGMAVTIPNVHMFFKTFDGRDLQILVMGYSEKVAVHIKQLSCYEDVAWGFTQGEKDLPADMLERLKQKSGVV